MDPTIIHFEIPAEDVDKLKSFYENLFRWKIVKTPGDFMEYWVIQTVPTNDQGMPMRPGVNGGMYKKQSESNIPINYIRVEDIDRALIKVVKLGGKVTMGKQEVPGIGYVAQIRDPEGNPIAMIHPMRE
ncbi:MAG: VOC family protein [Candidatus Bathyarchaeota archaeon]|nr:VOC family protein [Candidatus Bathyarchaeota archaeon]